MVIIGGGGLLNQNDRWRVSTYSSIVKLQVTALFGPPASTGTMTPSRRGVPKLRFWKLPQLLLSETPHMPFRPAHKR